MVKLGPDCSAEDAEGELPARLAPSRVAGAAWPCDSPHIGRDLKAQCRVDIYDPLSAGPFVRATSFQTSGKFNVYWPQEEIFTNCLGQRKETRLGDVVEETPQS